MKLHYSKKAVSLLARELRRASWGAALVLAGAGIKARLGIGYILGALAWVILQGVALVLDSLDDETED